MLNYILNILFGTKVHSYEQIGQYENNVTFSQMRDDRRFVLFTLKGIWRGRSRGPQWARKKEFVGYIVHWYTDRGIPIQNTKDGYRTVKAADLRLTEEEVELSTIGWETCAEVTLYSQIHDIRTRNGFYFEDYKLRANNNVG